METVTLNFSSARVRGAFGDPVAIANWPDGEAQIGKLVDARFAQVSRHIQGKQVVILVGNEDFAGPLFLTAVKKHVPSFAVKWPKWNLVRWEWPADNMLSIS